MTTSLVIFRDVIYDNSDEIALDVEIDTNAREEDTSSGGVATVIWSRDGRANGGRVAKGNVSCYG